MPSQTHALRSLLVSFSLIAAAAAQTTTPMPRQDQSIPPGVRLGLRMGALHTRLPTAPVLVLVPDGPSLINALKHWSIQRRFPILIDDGSDDARDNINRFNAAFAPKLILRYTPESPASDSPDAFNQAIAAAWGADPAADFPANLHERWRTLDWQPPGIVLTDPEDPARFAAAALAAGRGQILVLARLPKGNPNSTISASDLAHLNNLATAAAESSTFTFNTLGDDIDALTILATIPTKSPAGQTQGNASDGPNAITDALARNEQSKRWAYAGLIQGNAVNTTYRVMASLFIQPSSAFLFDGYARDFAPPYGMDPAAAAWRSVGFTVQQASPPLGSITQWRTATAGRFAPGIIQVNTSGQSSSFDLTPGRGSWRDIPALASPALVSFIHSFSAQNPATESNLAHQWLARGAFAYIGSVHEPFLGNFPTPELFARRLQISVPLGAAFRSDDAPIWKLNLLGDPLYTLIRSPARLDEAPTPDELLPGATSLTRELNAALTNHDLPQALRCLTLMNRMDDAASLARAALNDTAAAEAGFAMTPEAAAQAWPAARHAAALGDTELLTEIHLRLPPPIAEQALTTDQFWQAAIPAFTHPTNTPSDALVMALRTNIRDQTAIDDANALRPHIQRLFDRDAVITMYLQLAERATDPRQQRGLRRVLDNLR